MKTSTQLIQDAKQILDDSKRSGSFNRETEARVGSLLRLAELCRADESNNLDSAGRPRSVSGLVRESLERYFRRTFDDATVAFFRGMRTGEKVISPTGVVIERHQGSMVGNRRTGAIVEMRDLSIALDSQEKRTYTGMNEGTGSQGGTMVSSGFIPQVLAAMKRTDQILEAANWDTCATETGNPTHLPSLTDTSTSAVVVAELGAMSFANPTFGEISWPVATTWTSQTVKVSIQLNTDAPILAAALAEAFRVRFARGFGTSVVSTVLADAPATTNSASAGVVTQKDLLTLMGAVDAAYAAADTSGFVMNWKTLVAIVSANLTSNVGDALYLLRKDANGHYMLFDKPVFISPSMADIATGNVPVLFGDWSRLMVRNVPSEAVLRRYDELYMLNHQVGYEMIARMDAQILHAGGSGDDPIKGLTVA